MRRLLHLSVAPADATPIQQRNFLNVEIDAIGVGLASAASPFLPVFLTRLGATNFQVGLLTSAPALAGLFLAIAMGGFLQSRRNIVPWFSDASLLCFSAYALTGLVSIVVPRQYVVWAIILIWSAAALPQIMRSVAFSVVMNAVAGPRGRYALMSRRWSILGLTSTVTVTVAGQILHRLSFPVNYQLVFICLSVGGVISYVYTRRIELPDAEPEPRAVGLSLSQRLRQYVSLIRGEGDFVSFAAKRLVYLSGSTLAAPLFPLYYVREVQATDAWIGVISAAQTTVMLVGYSLWARQGRVRGSRFVLLWTTFSLSLYPALIASTHRVELIAVFTGLAGIFQAGLDLVFFDELMKTVPDRYSATFVSLVQSAQYLSAVVAPLLGTALADHIGLGAALVISSVVRLLGFGLFAGTRQQASSTATVD